MDIVENKKRKDIIEIFVKKSVGIILSDSEEKQYNQLDNEEKKIILELISSKSFLGDIEKIMDKIIEENRESFQEKNIHNIINDKNEDTILKNISK